MLDTLGLVLVGASMGGLALFITVAVIDERNVEKMLTERRMEVARQDAQFEAGNLRVTSLRIAWASMDPGARRTYIEMWGEPNWVKDSTNTPKVCRW
jgi:hypothetical protein